MVCGCSGKKPGLDLGAVMTDHVTSTDVETIIFMVGSIYTGKELHLKPTNGTSYIKCFLPGKKCAPWAFFHITPLGE